MLAFASLSRGPQAFKVSGRPSATSFKPSALMFWAAFKSRMCGLHKRDRTTSGKKRNINQKPIFCQFVSILKFHAPIWRMQERLHMAKYFLHQLLDKQWDLARGWLDMAK